jgi:hypothetical protein
MRLLAALVIALLITAIIRRMRRGYFTFRGFWNSEGLPIMILLSILTWAILDRFRIF